LAALPLQRSSIGCCGLIVCAAAADVPWRVVSLPAHAPQSGTPLPDDHVERRRAERRSPPRVLVIDDSVLVREAARVALETIGGFHVTTAESGEQGIELAETERPDAILLDVVMPGLDGIAVAQRLTALPATNSSPVVFLTGGDRPEDRERCEAVAAAGVIAKPFQTEQLASELASLLGWTR
jgi:two-component system alkaline phosphatase synthesis response regulator PhoP